MDTKKPRKEIEPFVRKVQKEFKPEAIILFGSRATGTDWKQSDYDFIVVSPAFENMHWLTRISKVVQYWDIPIDIDILPYTPREFQNKKKSSSLVRKALREGIQLAA